VEGYFDPFLAFVDHAVAEGFVRPEHRPLVQVARDPDGLLAALFGHATLSSGRR
jgi:predicted Rossmann-fold nucleotide-binding protein